MKTHKDLFIEMLKSSKIKIPYKVVDNGIEVDNSYNQGYSGLASFWAFDKEGNLLHVGHYES